MSQIAVEEAVRALQERAQRRRKLLDELGFSSDERDDMELNMRAFHEERVINLRAKRKTGDENFIDHALLLIPEIKRLNKVDKLKDMLTKAFNYTATTAAEDDATTQLAEARRAAEAAVEAAAVAEAVERAAAAVAAEAAAEARVAAAKRAAKDERASLLAGMIGCGGNCATPVMVFINSYNVKEEDIPRIAVGKLMVEIVSNEDFNLTAEQKGELIEVIRTLTNLVLNNYRPLYRVSPLKVLSEASTTAALHPDIGDWPFYALSSITQPQIETMLGNGVLQVNRDDTYSWNMGLISKKVSKCYKDSGFDPNHGLRDSIWREIVEKEYDEHPWCTINMTKQYMNAEIIRLKWLLMTILPEASEETRNKLVKDTIVSKSLELDTEDIKALKSEKLLILIQETERWDANRINLKDTNKQSILELACSKGYGEVVAQLLAAGAKVDESLYAAIVSADPTINERLIQSLFKEETIDDIETIVKIVKLDKIVKNELLMFAALNGRASVVAALLAAGAGVDERNEAGNTALMLAAHSGHASVVAMLMAAGAEAEAKDEAGNTAVMRAAHSGHASVVAKLLEAGAKVDPRDKAGNTALMRAAGRGYVPVVAALLAAGAGVDLSNKDGYTALMFAALNGRASVVAKLLEVDAIDEAGNTAVMRAAHSGHASVVTQLPVDSAHANESRDYKMKALNGEVDPSGLVDLASSDVFRANSKKADQTGASRVCAAVCCIACLPFLAICTLGGCAGAAKDTTGRLCETICNDMDYDGFSPKPAYADSLKPGEAFIRTDGNPMDLAALGATLGKEIGFLEPLAVTRLSMRGASTSSSMKYALEDKEGNIRMIGTYDVIKKAQLDLKHIEKGGDSDKYDTKHKEMLANYYRGVGFDQLTSGPTLSEQLANVLVAMGI